MHLNRYFYHCSIPTKFLLIYLYVVAQTSSEIILEQLKASGMWQVIYYFI